MWFHARDEAIKADGCLSSGRIYRANSQDGLSWTLEEGLGQRGSSLDVNEDEWWGFDTAHLGLGDVRLGQPDKVVNSPVPLPRTLQRPSIA